MIYTARIPWPVLIVWSFFWVLWRVMLAALWLLAAFIICTAYLLKLLDERLRR